MKPRLLAPLLGASPVLFGAAIATILAVAAFLLNSGFHNLLRVGLVIRRNREMSPTAYARSFRAWQPFVESASLGGHWFLVVTDGDAGSACSHIAAGAQRWMADSSLVVLVVDSTPGHRGVSRERCEFRSAPAPFGFPVLAVPAASLGPLSGTVVPQGFAVLDSAYRVVYGARDPSRLHGLRAVLALAESPRSEPSP